MLLNTGYFCRLSHVLFGVPDGVSVEFMLSILPIGVSALASLFISTYLADSFHHLSNLKSATFMIRNIVRAHQLIELSMIELDFRISRPRVIAHVFLQVSRLVKLFPLTFVMWIR